MSTMSTANSVLWSPSPEHVRASAMASFGKRFAPAAGTDYEALWRESVARPEAFWTAVWEFCGVIGERGAGPVLEHPDAMPGAKWFGAARLNFAENLLRQRGSHEALVALDESGRRRALSADALRLEVERIAAALAADGVGPGDRVAGFLPNTLEAVVAMLATARLGAVWSSCSPDFGLAGVVDRFGQIAPKVLFACDGYFYGGKRVDTRERVAQIRAALPELKRLVVVPFLAGANADLAPLSPCQRFDAYRGATAPDFARLPFDHPLYILYSSGTTGKPKCIVHGAGGTLLQHLKELVLQGDVRAGDRLFFYTTCGWMMWNWLVSGLAAGATVILYDGAPMQTEPAALWQLARRERLTQMGTSPKYLSALEKTGYVPRDHLELPELRTLLSTGSPLAPEQYDYVYRGIKRDLQLASISGGTDIISCFALGNPLSPVRRGELQGRGLGMAVDVYDEAGTPLRGEPGELVCTRPFPSMPVGFWNDAGGARYRAAYFERFPGAWHHGDFAQLMPEGGLVITGRSDATLNPGGVRIGTAEIYRVVDAVPEVLESVVVAHRHDNDDRVILFVRLRDGVPFSDTIKARIRTAIRAELTPRHMPAQVLSCPGVPRTLSGKITELAVRELIHGRPVKNADALANPQALEFFRTLPTESLF